MTQKAPTHIHPGLTGSTKTTKTFMEAVMMHVPGKETCMVFRKIAKMRNSIPQSSELVIFMFYYCSKETVKAA